MKVNEELFSIPEYEDLYSITKNGKIWSHRGKGKWLKIMKNHSNYCYIDFYKSGNMKRFFIHRLVAQAFIPNPKNKPEVNHKDCDPSNNDLDNLEWSTHKENIQHASRMGRMNYFLSEEHKRAMSKALKGRKFSEEHKKNIGEAHRGMKYKRR